MILEAIAETATEMGYWLRAHPDVSTAIQLGAGIFGGYYPVFMYVDNRFFRRGSSDDYGSDFGGDESVLPDDPRGGKELIAAIEEYLQEEIRVK